MSFNALADFLFLRRDPMDMVMCVVNGMKRIKGTLDARKTVLRLGRNHFAAKRGNPRGNAERGNLVELITVSFDINHTALESPNPMLISLI